MATAELLMGRDPDAAASRAYYAAFHAVSALLVQEGYTFRKHTAVEHAVHRELVHTGRWSKELGASFSWLVSLRYLGDYGTTDHVSPEDARAAVEAARKIVEAVQQSATGFP